MAAWRLFLAAFLILAAVDAAEAEDTDPSATAPGETAERRLNYHTPPDSTPPPMRRQAEYELPSPLVLENGETVGTKEQWCRQRRPELVREWTQILGKLEPTEADGRWFGDIREAVIRDVTEKDGYTRIELALPIETDFLQPHLLLIPRGQGKGPFPAVIAWTSTGPSYTAPEEWWGAWLARRGYVVLTGWSFIRHYRDGIDFRQDVHETLYKRFGRWSPLAKMVYDVRREVEYLRSRPEVDPQRIGFIGFLLSAKAALYVAAFAPEISTTVAIDPHLALHGATNYGDPWYLDWKRRHEDIRTDDYPVPELRGTVWSLLDADPRRPGFERNHHELMALCAPRALLVIGCSTDRQTAPHSDDRQSVAYVNRAREVYDLLGVPERLQYAALTGGHRATGPKVDAAWHAYFEKWLRQQPIRLDS